VLSQRDTYFEVPRGRLKLREQSGSPSQLISYLRSDATDARESRYRLIDVPQASALIDALSSTIGIRAVVAKRRQLFIWREVRIHLDAVDDLGAFVEFEAIAEPNSDLLREGELVSALREAFDIDDADLISAGYCDLLLAKRASDIDPPGVGSMSDA
jgi:adenylate cyclase class IV